MPVGYIASTIPAQVDHVSFTTLFHIAQRWFGDALQWVSIAELNNISDPWIDGPTDILIPPTLPGTPPTGILGI